MLCRYAAALAPGAAASGPTTVRFAEIRGLTGRRLIGGVDQWSDSTDVRSGAEWRPAVRRFYD